MYENTAYQPLRLVSAAPVRAASFQPSAAWISLLLHALVAGTLLWASMTGALYPASTSPGGAGQELGGGTGAVYVYAVQILDAPAMPADMFTPQPEPQTSPQSVSHSATAQSEVPETGQAIVKKSLTTVSKPVASKAKTRSVRKASDAQARPRAQYDAGAASAGHPSGSSAVAVSERAGGTSGSGQGQTAQDKPDASRANAFFGQAGGPSFNRVVTPHYPVQARRQGISGLVLLRVEILPDGTAKRMEVVKSPSPILTEAAMASIRQSSFHPMRHNGQAQACWSVVPVRFSLT